MGPMVGVLFAAIFALMGVNQLNGIQQRGASDQRAAATAQQLQQITAAAQTYIQSNAAAIALTATPTTPVTITVPMLQAAAGLSAGVNPVNPYGQTWQLQVLQVSPSVLQGLVLSQGGATISSQAVTSVAALTGGLGGFVPSAGQYGTLGANVAQGAYGGWQVSLAGYTNPGPGHLAALVQFSNAALTNNYLYRTAVPGQPVLNTMQTTLNMGNNSVTAANNVAANSATLAAGNTNGLGALKIGSTYYYGDSVNSAVRQSGTFYVQKLSGAPAPISASNAVFNSGISVQVGSAYVYGDATNSAMVQNGTFYALTPAWGLAPIVGQTVATSGSITAGTQLALGAVATKGSGCSPNGAVAASSDGTGTLLNCVNGIWALTRQGVVSSYLAYNGGIGFHTYCAINAEGDLTAGVYYDNTYSPPYWYMFANDGSSGRAMCID
jgi:hypothetical protein